MARQRRWKLTQLESRLAPATWDGGGADNKWSTPANWVGDVAPIPNISDDIVFPDGAAQKTNVNDFPAGSEFRRITLSGPDYQISGNAIVLGESITATFPTPVNPVDFPQLSLGLSVRNSAIDLDGDANMGVVLNGPVGTDLHVTGRYTINGVVSGPGRILTSGDLADLVLTANNTYTGNITNIGGGSFRIDGTLSPSTGVQASSFTTNPAFVRGSGTIGTLFIGNRAILAPGTAGPGTFHASQIIISGGSYAVDITGAGAGEYDQLVTSTSNDQISGSLILNVSGTPIAPGAHLRIIDVGGTNTVFGTFDGLPEGASVAVDNGVRFRITYHGGDGNDVELVTEAGPPTFTWDGGSTTSNLWSDAVNWVGDVAPTAGAALVFPAGAAQLSNNNDLAAGTPFENIVVGSGYVLNGNAVTLANGLSPEALTGSATVNFGVTLAAAQFFTTADTFSLTVGGPVNLNGFGLTVNGSGTLALTGTVSGAGGLVKIGTGTVSLAGNNTYSGVTDIRSGFLEVRSNNALGATGSGNDTLLGSNTTMTLAGGNLAIPEAFRFGQNSSGLAININASNSGSATLSGPLTVTSETNITGQAANPLVIAGSLTGSGFSAMLNVANVIVAATSVSPAFAGTFNGTLEFDGQAPGATSDAFNLSGTGTLGFVDVSGSGILRPGLNGVGTLHAHGLDVFKGSGGIIPVQPGHLAINVSAAGAGQVAVIGTVTLGGFLDVTVAPGFTPAAGARYRIIDNDGTDPVVNPSFFNGFTEGSVVATAGGVALRVTFHGGDGNDVELVAGSAPVSGRYAVAAGVGGLPVVNVYDGSTLIRSFFAYDQAFRGGVNVATADVTNDGVPDTITAPGFGGGPVIRIWDGRTGAMVRQFNAYDPAFRGGVNISTGLINSDVIPDIITGAGRTGGPHVKAFDANGNTLVSFLAYDPSFTGGVSVAGGNQLIITGAGPGGGPHVKTFNAQGTLLYNFFAYATNFTGGINVAYNSMNGTIMTAPKSGMAPLIKSFFLAGVPAFQFLAYSANFTGGVNLAVLPIGPGGTNSIITGPGPGGGPDVRVWSDNGATIQREFLAFDPGFIGGVYVG